MPNLEILIVDDHHLLLNGTIALVRDRFPHADIVSTRTVRETLDRVSGRMPDLAIVDLSIPDTLGSEATVSNGLKLLQQLMSKYPELNLMIQSSYVKALIRIQPEIENHQGGFTIVDKSLPVEVFVKRMEWALEGLTHTKDMQTDLELKPEWLETLELAFNQGLQDKAIAIAMFKSERNIRHYWTKIQDALGVYPEEGKNLRSLTQIRARELGLLD
ncbi:MAG: response regulator [Hormoscilla sp.]